MTPDTTSYLVLGLGVVFGITGIYVVSLVTRFRGVKATITTLETLEREDA